MFTLIGALMIVVTAIPAYIMFGMAIGPSISAHQFFPQNWFQIPAWLLEIGGITMPFVLPAVIFAAWSFYTERKYMAQRCTMGIGLLWLAPGAFVLFAFMK
ncbi:putative membrane protein [Rhizomicrobium palustre]|uniref:Putative membrane protein n=1 Tax=Rhizomicrobium palustre TaxID=189966 RepID=A0A846N5S6_9PROT|nr:hypothetical protein [Rhizomicrobium palustre]NIK90387.1 putative membrane protein [Rhizomicrobium palustre]